MERPEARFPAGQRLLPRPRNVARNPGVSAGSAVLPAGGRAPASQASPQPTPPGSSRPGQSCVPGIGATPERAPGLPSPSPGGPCSVAPLDARAERPWVDWGLVPLAPRGLPCDLSPLPWVCLSRASAQEQGQVMTQVPPSGHRGAGPVDGASEEATCSQRRAWGGHSACSHPPRRPHPRPLLSASSGPPRLSRAVSCFALTRRPGAAHRPTLPSAFISPLVAPPLENLEWGGPWRCPQGLEEAWIPKPVSQGKPRDRCSPGWFR